MNASSVLCECCVTAVRLPDPQRASITWTAPRHRLPPGWWIPVISRTPNKFCLWSCAGLLALLLSCSEFPEDLLVIAPPHFGAGTAEVRIVMGSGIDLETLEVAIDGAAISHQFQRTPDFAGGERAQTTEVRGVLQIAAGEHELFARAKLLDAASDVTHRLYFTPPPALEVIGIDPADGTVRFSRSDWIRLTVGAAAADEAIDSIGFSCDGTRREVSVHRVGDTRIVVDPSEDLPPDSRCQLVWRGAQGPGEWVLVTGTVREAVTVLYDRRVPRQLAPFPDDFWLATNPDNPAEYGVRLRTGGFGLPDQWLLNALATGVRSLDGFSPIAHCTVALSAAADAASLPSSYSESVAADASVMLFDVTREHADYGARIPFRIEARSEVIRGRADHALLIFPSVALKPRHRYGLVVTSRVRSLDGEPFGPSAFFAQVRDSKPSASAKNWVLERAQGLLEDVLAVSATASIPISRADVAFAVRFSIRSLDTIADDLVHIQKVTYEAPPPKIRSISIEAASDLERLDVNEKAALAAVIRGSWRSANWLDKESYLSRDSDSGLPVSTGNRRLRFTLALPQAAFAGPVPVVMYQHGNPGSAEEEVVLHASRYLAEAGFAVVGFDDVLNRQHGRSRLSTEGQASRQVADLLLRIITSSQMPGYFTQTIADQIAFTRAIGELASIEKFAMPAGSDAARAGLRSVFGIDPTAPLLYLGVSEGAHHGSMLLPFAPQIRAAALVSPGRRFSEVLIHQGSNQLLAPLRSLGFGGLTPTDIWVTMALIQMIFDDQDPNNFARFLYREPLDIAPSRRASVLMIEGLGDSFVPNHATNSLARTLGPVVHLSPPSTKVAGLEVASGSVAGNVDAMTTAALYQYVPQGVSGVAATPGCAAPPLSERSAHEGHYCAQSSAESIRQRVEFLRSALEGGIPRVSDPGTTTPAALSRSKRSGPKRSLPKLSSPVPE